MPTSSAAVTPLRAGRARPARLSVVLFVTFLGSVSGGAFWSGLFFVTARHYGFSATRNLVLGSAMGLAYAAFALGAGSLIKRLEGRLSPRSVVLLAFGGQAVAAALPLFFPHAEALLWIVGVLGVAASALAWPIVESFLSAGRHGAELREALGKFNVTWTSAVATALLVAPVVGAHNVLWTVAVTAVTNLVAMAGLLAFPSHPASHDADDARAHVGSEYPFLLRASLWLLPLSYVLSATLSPVLPHRLAALGVGARVETWAGATWMLARSVTLIAMWKTRFWHGRWATLLGGVVALVTGLALMLLSPKLTLALTGLALFGAGMGVLYFTAIYYSMSVGHAAVHAGGTFEALIGVGYFVGPALGIAGALTGLPALTVGLTWGCVGLVSVPAARSYRAALRARAARPPVASADGAA
jgi:hypothetical protein